MGRYDRLRRIEGLDPKGDHVEIYHLMCGYEFPWDMTRALEVALYRTYCVPSISALLDRTGEFYKRTQKRYDDTALIVAELSKWGYDSERGREALRRMNRAHSRFDISNGDYLYVLSTFIYEPIRWIERFGWRRMSSNEKRTRGWIVRILPARKTPNFFTDRKNRSYPFGYKIERLGPPDLDHHS